ncbi:hypothetical protein DSL64_15375 [Dyadobacter luteus]|uniref:Transcriptional regulator n=1 Tax=Dyadobacter luteus TaxID=2259619 RepID=A0A3D8Y9C0_9BACT|nr:hypothetical protein [Dyadobacter luteus]REA60063.1 hypothetical protein DSL64_15375 [Dyadobacter luteus]
MQNAAALLKRFFSDIEKDPRIGIKHIGLYTALILLWENQGSNGPLAAYSSQVMLAAKISSSATFVKLLHELAEYNYIRYEPSYYKFKQSRIFLTGI